MTSSIMKDILKLTDSIASSFRNILILGEFGSGKSWLAKRIHHIGNRCNKPFVTVNCHILEVHEALKKIFGYLILSETGTRINSGALEQCRGGVVFLKNFNSFPKNVQQEIMTDVQTSRIRPIGSKQTIEINQPQIICSIEIKSGHTLPEKEFFNDIIWGNDSHIIVQPPLRQRREDIALLIKTFLDQEFRSRSGIPGRKVSPEVIYQCLKYHWPGNIKQLKNAIEHAAITSEHDVIQPADLPISIKNRTASKYEG